MCCRLMRDKNSGEVVAVKFIERGEKVGVIAALLQWAALHEMRSVEKGGGQSPVAQRVMEANATASTSVMHHCNSCRPAAACFPQKAIAAH